jgi:hypothetical protein
MPQMESDILYWSIFDMWKRQTKYKKYTEERKKVKNQGKKGSEEDTK